MASRRYKLRRGDAECEYGVSVYAPDRIEPPPEHAFVYASKVAFASEEPRQAQGRDALEALCHALLLVEQRLLAFAQRGELFNEDGTPAQLHEFGLFHGMIGERYRKAIRESGLP